jgi:signal transduction histidine kinase
MNEDLLDVLLTNLITNAIRYNVQGGIMVVSLTENLLRISNTGLPLQLSPDRLFDRFEKNDKSGDSPGLGLTIVKQICELNNCQIRYLTEDNFHILEIYFKNFN